MTDTYRICEIRNPAADLVLGSTAADFSFPVRPTVSPYLGVLAKRGNDGSNIMHYQASKLD